MNLLLTNFSHSLLRLPSLEIQMFDLLPSRKSCWLSSLSILRLPGWPAKQCRAQEVHQGGLDPNSWSLASTLLASWRRWDSSSSVLPDHPCYQDCLKLRQTCLHWIQLRLLWSLETDRHQFDHLNLSCSARTQRMDFSPPSLLQLLHLVSYHLSHFWMQIRRTLDLVLPVRFCSLLPWG